MFEYVLTLIYNLPKSEGSIVYSEMTDKPNEIRLSNVFFKKICVMLLRHVLKYISINKFYNV